MDIFLLEKDTLPCLIDDKYVVNMLTLWQQGQLFLLNFEQLRVLILAQMSSISFT